MSHIIGQAKLLNQINNYTDATLPKAMLFISKF